MRTFIISIALLLTAAAHAFDFGAPVPLTNANYGALDGEIRLASNGDEVFVFFARHGTIRTKVYVAGETRISRSVMTTTATSLDDFDVVWTGTHFLLVATHGNDIHARLLDRNAFASGDEFVIVANARTPRVASNGKSVMLLHRAPASSELRASLFEKEGDAIVRTTLVASATSSSYAVASNGSGFAAIAGNSCTLFDANGGQTSRIEFASGAGATQTTIASDGSRYLATWFSRDGGFATSIDASGNGGVIATFATEDEGAHRQPAATWTGSDYVVAYVRAAGAPVLRVVHFDRDGHLTTTEGPRFYDDSFGSTSVVRTRHGTFLSWNPSSQGTVETLPLQLGSLSGVTYGQAEQQLLAVTTSSYVTLVVWSELESSRRTAHAGVRFASGWWVETSLVLAHDGQRAVAAGTGDRFAIAVSDEHVATLMLFDAFNAIVESRVAVPFVVTGIAAGANGYALAGVDANGALVVAQLGATGGLSSPVVVGAGEAAIAFDGANFLLSTRDETIRLRPDLTILDRQSSRCGTTPRIVSNRTDTVVFCGDDHGISATLIARDGARATTQVTNAPARDLRATVWRDAFALLWAENEQQHRAAIVTRFAEISETVTLDDDTPGGGRFDTELVTLPNGRIGYLASAPWVPPPHQGSPRVTMRVADPFLTALPPVPAPPGVRVLNRWNGVSYTRIVRIEHSDRANGYRVEYQLDAPNASWNEYAEYFRGGDPPGGTREFSLNFGAPARVRVRTITDFGISAPSSTGGPEPPLTKRRAVR